MKRGRPILITEPVLHKLEEVFSLGGTDMEACVYAGISKSTLYNYQEKNPDFLDRKELLKEKPILLARRTINKALEEDSLTARWFVERKDRTFNLKQEVDITTGGEKLEGGTDIAAIAARAAELLRQEKMDEGA